MVLGEHFHCCKTLNKNCLFSSSLIFTEKENKVKYNISIGLEAYKFLKEP